MHKKEKNKHVIRESLEYLFKEVWYYKPSYYLINAADIIMKAAKPFINIMFPKFIIDELLGNQNISRIIWYVACMVLGNMIVNIFIACADETIAKSYNDDFSKYFDAKLGLKIMQMDFENTENKETLEKVEKAKTGLSSYSGGAGGVMNSLAAVITGIITLCGVLGILIYNARLLFVVIGLSVIGNAYFNAKNNEIQLKHFKKLSALSRAFNYVLFKLSDFRYGKDIRLYQADNMMLSKADQYNMDTAKIWENQSKEVLKYTESTRIIMAVRDGLAYLYIGILAIKKIISIGDFSMLVSSSETFGNALNNIITQLQELQKKSSYIYEYVTFMKLPNREKEGTEKCSQEGQHTIEFRDVYFRYPGSDNYILEGVSIKIESGEHLSIVGMNGAGKTTFIKLLCRLYPVTKGEIRMDGKNIQEYDSNEYTKLLSVVFQDFRLVAFSLKENIALGKASEIEDEELNELLEEVGLTERVRTLPSGLSTPVFHYYDKAGFEPSGGEQQKIAIARALYKNSPIVILDEPTAALDPVAEYDIYRQFNRMVEGKTAIYISHRLSSCKFCDRIAVFANHVIAEYGTHDELSKKEKGIYAEMFRTQAQYYA